MKVCEDLACPKCAHSMTRHGKPAIADPEHPHEVVCFECLYGPRNTQRQR